MRRGARATAPPGRATSRWGRASGCRPAASFRLSWSKPVPSRGTIRAESLQLQRAVVAALVNPGEPGPRDPSPFPCSWPRGARRRRPAPAHAGVRALPPGPVAVASAGARTTSRGGSGAPGVLCSQAKVFRLQNVSGSHYCHGTDVHDLLAAQGATETTPLAGVEMHAPADGVSQRPACASAGRGAYRFGAPLPCREAWAADAGHEDRP